MAFTYPFLLLFLSVTAYFSIIKLCNGHQYCTYYEPVTISRIQKENKPLVKLSSWTRNPGLTCFKGDKQNKLTVAIKYGTVNKSMGFYNNTVDKVSNYSSR